jgi:6-phosphogluconolactonase/glucosamine-6-phosphate isomerase/deaminase
VAAAVSQHLRREPLERLTVTLTDERYGPVGHADSNWRQLATAGFDLPGATMLPVLKGLDMPSTVAEFAAVLKHHLSAADFALGFFGIGADGHTAGILPGSPAVAATEFAAGYDAAALGSSAVPAHHHDTSGHSSIARSHGVCCRQS